MRKKAAGKSPQLSVRKGSKIYHKPYGSMVRSHNFLIYHRIPDPVPYIIRDYEIVYTPAHILGPGIHPVGPPAVLFLIGIEISESIREAAVKQPFHLAPLLIGKTGIFMIGLIIFKIYGLMGHIEVPAEYQGLLCRKLHGIGPEAVLPLHAVGKPLELILGIRSIDRHKVVALIFKAYHPSLCIMLLIGHAKLHIKGLLLRKYGSPGIALLFRIVPIRIISLIRISLPKVGAR